MDTLLTWRVKWVITVNNVQNSFNFVKNHLKTTLNKNQQEIYNNGKPYKLK